MESDFHYWTSNFASDCSLAPGTFALSPRRTSKTLTQCPTGPTNSELPKGWRMGSAYPITRHPHPRHIAHLGRNVMSSKDIAGRAFLSWSAPVQLAPFLHKRTNNVMREMRDSSDTEEKGLLGTFCGFAIPPEFVNFPFSAGRICWAL